MATLKLGPVQDVSRGHTCSSGSSGYLMINETLSDNDASYIYQTISSTSSQSATSRFRVSGESAGKVKISSLTLGLYAKESTTTNLSDCQVSYSLSVNGMEGGSASTTLTSSYANSVKTYSAADLGIADTVFDSFDAANIVAQITTTGKKSNNKVDDFELRITTVYVNVTYELVSDTTGTGVYLKRAGAQVQAAAVWKKENGLWVKADKTAIDAGKNYRIIQR